MTAFCGMAHFSIVMASVNGCLYYWTPRPAKQVQPLAPNFTEIEENIEYVEKEDEFESEVSSEEEASEDVQKDDAFPGSLIADLDKKQRKLAKTEIDVDTVDPLHQATVA